MGIHSRELSETIVECWRDDGPMSCLLDVDTYDSIALSLADERLLRAHALVVRTKPKENTG